MAYISPTIVTASFVIMLSVMEMWESGWWSISPVTFLANTLATGRGAIDSDSLFNPNLMAAKLKKFLREWSHSNDKHLYRGRTCRFKAYIAILGYLMLIKGLFIVVSIFVYNVYMRIGAIYINIEYEGGII